MEDFRESQEFNLQNYLRGLENNLDEEIRLFTKCNFKKVIVLGIIFLIFMVFMELILRFLFPIYTDVLFIGDEFTGYRHIPNKEGQFYGPEFSRVKIKINSEGFRDVEHSIENEDGKYRVAFLGNSITESLQTDFDKTFYRLLANESEKIEVFNFGINSYSTGQEYLSYEHYAKKYNPDMVILIFWPNDPIGTCCKDSSKPCYYIEEGEVKQSPFTPRIHSDLKLFVGEYFKTIVYLRERYYRSKRIEVLQNDIEIDGIYDPNKVFLKEYEESMGECWDLSGYFLRKLKQEINSAGSEFKVIIFPHPISIYEENRKMVLNEQTILNESYFDFNKPYPLMEEILIREGIDYINLFEDFKNSEKRLNYVHDSHLNDDGHKLVSEALINELKKEGKI
jgi:hypothetical protein